ncbi:unnamed protein product [Arabidopsis thaliana]|uniref:(thale cress) hypothetical protein n=1 Tax=Arabidopsis thaliana TaxID=3702 RepID=A0A7G2EFZ0_ARATH|nr:unnamed protein product [Arabidopsis thaliana]
MFQVSHQIFFPFKERFSAVSRTSGGFFKPQGRTKDHEELLAFCLGYVMQHASSSEGYVLSKVSSVAAQLMKRGWLEFTPAQKEVFFYQHSREVCTEKAISSVKTPASHAMAHHLYILSHYTIHIRTRNLSPQSFHVIGRSFCAMFVSL